MATPTTPLHPRDLKDWFSSDKTLKKRDLAFQVCFALGLNVDETNDFFRRVMFERSFDCHSINEAVPTCFVNDDIAPAFTFGLHLCELFTGNDRRM